MFTVDAANPVDWTHPENAGLRHWFLALPGLCGGGAWPDLTAPGPAGRRAALTNFTPPAGWRPTERPGGRGALRFDGVDDFAITAAKLPAVGTVSPHTHAAWVRVNGALTSSYHFLYSEIVQGGGGGTAISLNAQRATQWWCDGGNTGRVGSKFPALGEWCHVAVAFDVISLQPSFYFNGRFDVADTAVGSFPVTTSSIVLGANSTGSGNWANVDLDDVRSWGRALTAAEVLEVYRGSLRGCPGRLRPARPARLLGAAARGPAAWPAALLAHF